MKKEIFVLGNNIVSDYFSHKDEYRIEPYSWIYKEEYAYEKLLEYKAVIYCEEKKNGDFQEVMNVNFTTPSNICHYLNSYNIPFIYISTADFYNGSYEWNENTEEKTDFTLSTDYLLSKRIAERFIEDKNSIILRIKKPFGEYPHKDNWLMNLSNRFPPSDWLDCQTYLGDLEKSIKVLLDRNERGIFNIVQTETCSDLYFCITLNINNCENLKCGADGDMSEELAGADVNSSKISKFIELQPVIASAIYCWDKLKSLTNEQF